MGRGFRELPYPYRTPIDLQYPLHRAFPLVHDIFVRLFSDWSSFFRETSIVSLTGDVPQQETVGPLVLAPSSSTIRYARNRKIDIWRESVNKRARAERQIADSDKRWREAIIEAIIAQLDTTRTFATPAKSDLRDLANLYDLAKFYRFLSDGARRTRRQSGPLPDSRSR